MDDAHNSQRTLQVVTCDDGSHTLFVAELKEHYHSTYGAIQESRHVFIDAGLRKASEVNKKIQLLEIGFGTGLNTLLTYLHAIQHNLQIEYMAIEAYPVSMDIISKLNYPQLLMENNASQYYRNIIFSDWNQRLLLSPNLTLTKVHCKFEDVVLESGKFNLVFFDAFSPAVQPELWAEEIFEKLFTCIDEGGILVTYCCKGNVKRALTSAGFRIEKLPGPPGKREMIRATKCRK